MYVDDVQISFKSRNLFICERQMQFGVNKLAGWAGKNRFTLNPMKSTYVIFSKRGGIQPDPDIKINGDSITVKKEQNFLGVALHEKLTFTPHIKQHSSH